MSASSFSETPQKTRLAIAGLGLVGLRHLEAIGALPDCTLCAVMDPRPEVRATAQRHGAACFDNFAQMLETARPDGVILSTPTKMHVTQAMDCVRAGIPALVEKPLSDDLPSAATLVAAAQRAGVDLLVGHHRRYNPLIENAKTTIDAGKLGDIRAIHATCWFYKPDSYFDVAPWRKRAGAGPISVNLVHDIDLLRHLCGEIVTVQAQAAPSQRGYDNEDLAAALLTFENGAIGTISVSDSVVSPWSWEFTAEEYPIYPSTGQSAYMIGGSKAALSIPDQRLWAHVEDPDWWTAMVPQVSAVPPADPLIGQMAHFVDVIAGRAKPRVSGMEGLRSLQVVDAISRAARSGGTITLAIETAKELSA